MPEFPERTGEKSPLWPATCSSIPAPLHPSPTKASRASILPLGSLPGSGLCVGARHALTDHMAGASVQLTRRASPDFRFASRASTVRCQTPPPAPGLRAAGSVAHSGTGCPGPPPPKVLRCRCPSSRRRPGARPPQAPSHRGTLTQGPQCNPPQPTTAAVTSTIPWRLQAGRCSRPWAARPCAVSSSSSRRSPSPGGSCAPPPSLAPGPPYPHPCPAGVLKLQDNVNLGLFPWPSKAAAAALRKVSGSSEPPVPRAEAASLSPRGCSHGSGPTDGKAPSPEVRTRCVCLINSRHSTVFAFTQSWGMEAPNSNTSH